MFISTRRPAHQHETNERALAEFARTSQRCLLTGHVIQNKRLPLPKGLTLKRAAGGGRLLFDFVYLTSGVLLPFHQESLPSFFFFLHKTRTQIK